MRMISSLLAQTYPSSGPAQQRPHFRQAKASPALYQGLFFFKLIERDYSHRGHRGHRENSSQFSGLRKRFKVSGLRKSLQSTAREDEEKSETREEFRIKREHELLLIDFRDQSGIRKRRLTACLTRYYGKINRRLLNYFVRCGFLA